MSARFWRYLQFDRMENKAGGGATTALEAEIIPAARSHPAAQLPTNMGVPIEALGGQIEGVDFPFFSRFSDANTPRPEIQALGRQRRYTAGLLSTYNLGMSTAIMAEPPDTTPIFIAETIFDPSEYAARKRRSSAAATYMANQGALPYPPAFIPASTYSTAVCRLLDEIQHHLLETPDGGATWGSGLWTASEVVAYLNQRLARFLVETGVIQSRTTVVGVANQEIYDLPTDWIETRRVAWAAGATTSELPRQDAFVADSWIPTWESITATRPSVYVEDPNISLQIRVARKPSQAGTLDLIGIRQHPTMTNDCSILSLPDEWCVYVKWGVMADMLSKEGEANDPERAALCEARFDEGVNLARLLMGGPA